MRGAGMAAAYGAGAAAFGYLAFRAGFWIFDTGVGAWCRWKDKQSREEDSVSDEDIKPAVGQVWQDNDPRVDDRLVRIMAVGEEVAWCVAWYPKAKEVPPRKVRIKLARFRPTSTGYRFVRDESEVSA